MVSFTPQGVGVVEAAVLVAFTLFGINQATGMAVVMVYRGIVFWLPFLIGAVMIQRTGAFKGSTKQAVQNVDPTKGTLQNEQAKPTAEAERTKDSHPKGEDA